MRAYPAFCCSLLTSLLLFAIQAPIHAQAPTAEKPVPAQQAAAKMKLPAGFEATLFAGEPDIVQPIAFTFDERGRMWVVECFSYPTWSTPEKPIPGRDRVTILEDVDGDGKFDKKTLFLDNGVNLSGIEVGFGGVWLTAVPQLLFIPDHNRDDKPDSPAEVLLDGWDLKAKHNVVNGLAWGPDGWLYGLNGILSNSLVGPPGAKDSARKPLNCGVWRYHPVRKVFEPFASGTTNPWGLDWDAYGELFITNCVIKHLFHVTQGGRYERMFGQDVQPFSYGLIESCADHIHWGGGHWTSSRGGQGPHDVTGGGHAHSGCMIYQGENWPAEYRDKLFTCNIHGARVNCDRLKFQGSGYIAKHDPDFLLANDPWFRGLAVKQGPGGMVFVSDWSDTGECHDYQETDIERGNGRIYRVALGKKHYVSGDLAEKTDGELAQLVVSRDEWESRIARRLLHERFASGGLDEGMKDQLVAAAQVGDGKKTLEARLRSLWAAYQAGALPDARLSELLTDPETAVRGWAATLLVDDGRLAGPQVDALLKLAAKETSPRVQLRLAATLQRVPKGVRTQLAAALIASLRDPDDPNLPLMLWFGLEPLVAENPVAAAMWLDQCHLPLVRQNIVQRILAALPEKPGQAEGGGVALIVHMLGALQRAEVQLDLCNALRGALAGKRSTPKPAAWNGVYATLAKSDSAELRTHALALAAAFDDQKVLAELHATVANRSAPPSERLLALQLLDAKRPQLFSKVLKEIVKESGESLAALRSAAIRALAGYDDAEIPTALVAAYPSLSLGEKQDALQTLAAREASAAALLDAVETNRIPRSDVTAVVLRQLQASKWTAVKARLEKTWGVLRPASQAKKELAAKYKAELTAENLRSADVARGRQLFTQHCAACHKMFGEGGKIGPEITGAQRQNLDYLLDNVLDPSAVVAREYQTSLLLLSDGRVLTGIVSAETPESLTLQTANERVIVPLAEIDERQAGKTSMMPEGIFERMTAEQVRDLVGYLQSPVQIP